METRSDIDWYISSSFFDESTEYRIVKIRADGSKTAIVDAVDRSTAGQPLDKRLQDLLAIDNDWQYYGNIRRPLEFVVCRPRIDTCNDMPQE